MIWINATAFVLVFFVTWFISLWLGSFYLASLAKLPRCATTLVILVTVMLAALTAYAVVYGPKAVDCIEYAPQGSGLC